MSKHKPDKDPPKADRDAAFLIAVTQAIETSKALRDKFHGGGR